MGLQLALLFNQASDPALLVLGSRDLPFQLLLERLLLSRSFPLLSRQLLVERLHLFLKLLLDYSVAFPGLDEL